MFGSPEGAAACSRSSKPIGGRTSLIIAMIATWSLKVVRSWFGIGFDDDHKTHRQSLAVLARAHSRFLVPTRPEPHARS